MDVEELFGKPALKVMEVLRGKEPMPLYKIMRLTGLTSNDVAGALGWLAHSGKIEVAESDLGIFFRLK